MEACDVFVQIAYDQLADLQKAADKLEKKRQAHLETQRRYFRAHKKEKAEYAKAYYHRRAAVDPEFRAKKCAAVQKSRLLKKQKKDLGETEAEV